MLLNGAGLFSQSVSLTIIQPDCNNDGIVQANISGITPPYDVVWYQAPLNPGYLMATHSNVTASTDQLINLDTYMGGAFDIIVQVKQGNVVAATSNSVHLTSVVQVSNPHLFGSYTCPAAAATVTVGVTNGNPPYSVAWTQIGNGYNTVVTGTTALLTEGTYEYAITDAAGCTLDILFDGMFDPLDVSYFSGMSDTIITTVANCIDGTALVTNITGGTAPYSYLWNNGAVTNSVTSLSMGQMEVKVTDAAGCHLTTSSYINQAVTVNAGVTSIDASCLLSSGSATAMASGGQAPYTYAWSNGQMGSVISGLSPGYFWVEAKDANGCINAPWSSYVQINNTSPVVVTYTSSVSQCTLATGSASLSVTGGTAPYNIAWSINPVQTGSVLVNVLPGSYPFVVTDANGCMTNGTAYIWQAVQLSGALLSSPDICNSGNGSAQWSYLTGTAPYTYQWTTGATSQAISGLQDGNYACTVVDAAGCTLSKSVYVDHTSPLALSFGMTPASCLYTPDGVLQVSVNYGTPPYTYQWSNGAAAATATGLLPGQHYVTVIDAAGCKAYGYSYVDYNHANTSCYCVISGSVYNDANSNCLQDTGETGIPHVMLECSGIGYVFTDTSGAYSFNVPSGSYTITEYLLQDMNLGICQNLSQTVLASAAANCTIPLSFANTLIPVHNLHMLTTSVGSAIPGNAYQQKVIICNEGTYTESSVQLDYAHDGQLIYTSASPSMLQVNAAANPNLYNTVSIPSIAPNASASVFISYNVPTNIPLGTIVNFKDTASAFLPVGSGWQSDYTPWDNVNNFNEVVIGSFDPNFKEVSPKGAGRYGVISYNDTILEYVVHFQNTGTYMAQKVVIKDTLDKDLDPMSFMPGYSDHHYIASMDHDGVITFTFNDINLSCNYPQSTGMVSYRVKTKRNLSPGTEFLNNAAIFFDYNAPVITNTTINSLQVPSDVQALAPNQMEMSLYPNPSDDVVHVNLPSAEGMISVLNILGESFLSESTHAKSLPLNTRELNDGIYFVRFVSMSGQTYTLRLIKQH